ncbi:MAG: tetratricopeptide repeat protein [Myxococcales bacterium]|nr:tetratricopeptide repeat protein [Polyangiaceae bacterium]MDW8248297.1 tetratricopeptide repeat protein [Myxococcales bacterium]
MPTESKAPRALSVEKLGPLLDETLEDELLVLSSMIQAMSRGELPPELWEKLHEAALRDDRLVELAAAYEESCQPRVIRRMAPAQQSELLVHAAEFLHRTLEDVEGAQAYLERAVAADPTNRAAFDLLENLLIEAGNGGKLCELYVNLAGHAAVKEEQVRLLRRAAELADVFAEDAPRVIAIYERLLKVEPGDVEARRALEGLYRRTSRWTELARMLEQSLPKKGTEDEVERELRGKLIELYRRELQQPERVLIHAEELLKLDPGSQVAREGMSELLSHKLLGARAALALEAAYDRTGEQGEVIRMLGLVIEVTRGPQRIEAQKRLGVALLRAGNDEEAFPALERALLADAGDELLRASYRQAGARLGRLAEVAKGLLRCAGTARSTELKLRLHLEAGEALLEAGETKKAQASLLAATDAEDPSIRLTALRRLIEVTEEPLPLADLLGRLALVESSEDARAAVRARQGEILQGAGELHRAIEAWQAALFGMTRDRAEEALAALYEQVGAWSELVSLLLEMAVHREGEQARKLLVRAASLRSEQLGDEEGALAVWDRIADRFGRSEETSRQRRALLERLGRYAELVAELVAESSTGAPEVRAELWGLVAQLRLERLGDGEGALAACQSALSLLPGERRAAEVASKLLAGPQRLAAAMALLPIYREQAEFWGLIRALEVLGQEHPEAPRRLAALGEAAELVASDDPPRALRLVVDGLRLSLQEDLGSTSDWLVRLELLSSATGGPDAHADLLLSALGERELNHPALVDLARRASASLVEAGRVQEGLELLGRVFRAEPARVDVAPSLDWLLLARGDTAARGELWRLVLRYERRREARIEALRFLAGVARQQGNLSAEAEALGELLVLDPSDQGARAGRMAVLRALGREQELAELLFASLNCSQDAEEALALLLALLPLVRDEAMLLRFEQARRKPPFPWTLAQQERLLVACAQAYAAVPERRTLAAEAFRSLIEQTSSPEHVASFEAALASWPREEPWITERRWLFAWRAQHDADRPAVLLAWAEAEEAMGNLHTAVDLYHRLLALDPEGEVGGRKLVRLLLELGDAEGAQNILLARRARVQGAERRRVDIDLARLLVGHFRRLEEALRVLEGVLEGSPKDEEAWGIVEQIHQEALALGEEGVQKKAEDALERASEVLEDSARVTAILERLLAGGGSLEQRQRWYQGLLARAGGAEGELRVLLRAVGEAPLDGARWDLAEQAARNLGRPGEVLEAYREHLSNPAVAAVIGERAINFYEEWFEEPEGVMELVERVLLADAGAQWAFDRLKVFYGAEERWQELLTIYDRMIAAARSDEDRLVFLEDAVEIARDFTRDDGRAISYLEKLVQVKPGDEPALVSLERLYERTGRFAELLALLSEQIPRSEPRKAKLLRVRVASLWLEVVGEVPRAFEVIQHMLAVDPEDSEAWILLERLLATFQRPAPGASLSPEWVNAYLGAAMLLKPRLQRVGSPADRIRIREIELEGAVGVEQRAALLRELIVLKLSEMQDPTGAFEDALALLDLLPGEETVLQEIVGLAVSTGQPRRLLERFNQLAQERSEVAAVLLLEGARLAEKHLGDTELALRYQEQAIKADTQGVVALAAARERVALLQKLPGQERLLFDAMEDLVRRSPDPVEREELPTAMAALACGVLANPLLLARSWELRCADTPDDPAALSGLVEAYRALGRWSDLIAVLERRATLHRDEGGREDLLEAARILEDTLGDLPGALRVWGELRSRFGEEEATLSKIASLLERLEHFEDLVLLLREQISGAEGKPKGALLVKLAEVEGGRCNRPQEAVQAYLAALELSPPEPAALVGLRALMSDPRVQLEATEALLNHFQRHDDGEGILSLLPMRLALAGDDETRVLLLLEAAALLETKLARPLEALEALRRALVLAPADLGLAREVLRVARAVGALGVGVEALRRAAGDPRASLVARSLWLLLAEALCQVDEVQADDAYERALALGEDVETLQALVELRRSRRGAGLVDALLRLASALPDAPSLWLEAGHIALELQDLSRTREIARYILTLARDSAVAGSSWLPAADWAIEVLTGEGPARVEPLLQVALLKEAEELPFELRRKALLLGRCASICEGELQELEEALRCYRQIEALFPGNRAILDAMGRVFRLLGRREELLGVLRRQVELCSEVEQRAALRLELACLLRDAGKVDDAVAVLQEALGESAGLLEARILSLPKEERSSVLDLLAEAYLALGRGEEARHALEQALLLASDPGLLRRRLMELYRDSGHWGRLAELMVDEARSLREPRSQALRMREAAMLLIERRGDPGTAVQLLREAVELAPEEVVLQLSLGETLRLAGYLEEAAVVLRKLVESYGARRPKERALAHLQLGFVLRAMGDSEAAFSELDVAARIDPAHPRILQMLGRIAAERGELERAQKALRSLLLLLPRGGRSEQGVSRVEVQLALADLARRQGDAARADEMLETILAHVREHEDEWALLEDHLRKHGFHGPLARSLELRLGMVQGEAQLPLLQELSSLYLHHLEKPAVALDRACRAVLLAPERNDLRLLAVEVARATGGLAFLISEISSLAATLAVTSPEVAVELWIDLAGLYEQDLQDRSATRAALEQAERCAEATLDPERFLLRIWPRLDAVLQGDGDPNALAAFLRRRLLRERPQGRGVETSYRLAALLLSLPDPEEGLDVLRDALSMDPRVEQAAGLLQQALASHGDNEHFLRFYERFAREQGRTGDLIDALMRLGALPGLGTAPLREAAELAIQVGHGSAEALLREISELDQNPSSLPDVIWALVTLAERVQKRGELALAVSLKERAADLASADERRALLLDIAALAQGPLQDPIRAAKLYETLLEEKLVEPQVWQPLIAIYRASEDDPRLAALLTRLLPLVEGPTRSALRAELIEVLLRKPDSSGLSGAIALLQEALMDAPDDLSLANRLADLLERAGDQRQLAALLERQLDRAREQGEYHAAASLALRLGALYEQLSQESKALDFYRIGVSIDPNGVDLLRALLRLVERREDSFETAELLERLLPLEKGPAAAALALRLAALHEANWNPEAAERALERGYEAHPDAALRDQLAERYAESGSWRKLAALHERDAAIQDSSEARITALRRAAEVQRKHLNNPGAAADLLQQALALAPADRAVLLGLLEALGALGTAAAWRRAGDALTLALEHRAGDGELLQLRGEIHLKLGAFEAALVDLEASVAAGNAQARPLLREGLVAAVGSIRTPAVLRPWRLRLAELLWRDGDEQGARAQLEAANRDEPGQPEVLRALVALERQAGRWGALLAPLRTLASRAEGEELTMLALELAEVASRAELPGEAQATLERALQRAPGDVRLRAALREVYERCGARRELARLLREDAETLREPGSRFEALLAAARLLVDPQQGDLKLASQILEEARGLRPDDLELALLLAEIHLGARRPHDAIQVLEKAALAHRGRRSKALGQVYLRKARIELSLGERTSALQSLSKAFDNDGNNGALAMELGLLALELNDEQNAIRAFRAITLLKVSVSGEEGTTAAAKAQAYYQLSLLALGQADRRKARLLVEKALGEDASLEVARQLRDELLRSG